ncbi:hypothetical protein PCE1_002803 [Barthelona sp. PCE]
MSNQPQFRVVKVLRGHSSSIVSLDVDTENMRILSAGLDKKVMIWSIDSGRTLKYDHSDVVRSARFTNSHSSFVTAGDGQKLSLHKARVQPQSRLVSSAFFGRINEICCSPVEDIVAVVCNDRYLRVIDYKTRRIMHSQITHTLPTSVDVSVHGLVAYSNDRGSIQVFDPMYKASILGIEMEENISQLRFHPSGHFLAAVSENGSLHIYSLIQKKLYHRYVLNTALKCVAWHDSGSIVAVIGEDNHCYVYDLNRKMALCDIVNRERVDAIVWKENMLVMNLNQQIVIWNSDLDVFSGEFDVSNQAAAMLAHRMQQM